MEYARDFPKIECPFVREETEDGYLATPEINTSERTGEPYDWVAEDENVIACEKLHGTNVSIIIENGSVVGVWNRRNRIPAWSSDQGDEYIHEGIFNSMQRGYVDPLTDGQHFGELLGPTLHNNPYDLEEHIWIPFSSYVRRKLRYESWGKYGRSYEDIRDWFKMGVIPLFYSKWHGLSFDEAEEKGFVEGVVFTHTKPDEIGTIPYAKVRYDMFSFD